MSILKHFPEHKMWQLFQLACGAYFDFTFKKTMKGIHKTQTTARICWLANLGEQKRWTKHKFDLSIKCDVNNINFVESFNATLGIDRCRPVLTLLEGQLALLVHCSLVNKEEECLKD